MLNDPRSRSSSEAGGTHEGSGASRAAPWFAVQVARHGGHPGVARSAEARWSSPSCHGVRQHLLPGASGRPRLFRACMRARTRASFDGKRVVCHQRRTIEMWTCVDVDQHFEPSDVFWKHRSGRRCTGETDLVGSGRIETAIACPAIAVSSGRKFAGRCAKAHAAKFARTYVFQNPGIARPCHGWDLLFAQQGSETRPCGIGLPAQVAARNYRSLPLVCLAKIE